MTDMEIALCVLSFLAGGFAVCLRFEKTTGPLIRAAEAASRALTSGDPELLDRIQEMAKLAYLRRKL